jgi:adenosylcobinamide-GDP ribazoletransferase
MRLARYRHRPYALARFQRHCNACPLQRPPTQRQLRVNPVPPEAVQQCAFAFACVEGVINYTAMFALRQGLSRYFAAQQLLTRLRCPSWTAYSPDDLARSTIYFPWVGVIVGGISAAVVALFGGALEHVGSIAAVFAVASSAIVTGGFHEDAFADVCDAFGGMTQQRRREIMRDSLVGSFGASGVALLLMAKVLALTAVGPWKSMAAVVVVAHVLARWTSVVMIRLTAYVEDPESLAKPYAGMVTNMRLVVATLLPSAPLAMLLFGFAVGGGLLVGLVVLCALSSVFFKRWLGGITGDCLGAVNQMAELAVYVVASHPNVAAELIRHLS